ncbi:MULTISPECIES: SDR family NAD(P)-dependent oxidoreductase [Paenibacillus]|uniref:SDR family NAD(P)-dependent oxidoreductase n=1 Tax=Paenibacillus TaxID=44249 RepID=UPI0007BEDB0C|nr:MULTISPECIES: SDR family NAD(P)-dependent oxidoreductase [Paenibacillus]MCZ1263462.1 NAD-dependent epimerase/dehydratase family protein [Paenibacillus tundrae]SDL25274.1 UDP-glucuronate decarboxylase [Paenibacillus sp. OK060]SHN74416.1 UDP-glucuronate decarboxylase [Paenibacillus sp. ov031]
MKHVVVTGAAGFLGSHLVKSLIDQGHQVTGIDNLSTGVSKNLQEVANSPLFFFREADVTLSDSLDFLVDQPVDEVYHLASPASPKFYQADSIGTIWVNTRGTYHLLELARTKGAKFLYSSTSEAYGDPEVHPQPESYRGNVNTWGPRACYDEAKRLGEVFCYEYYTKHGVSVRVARIFNTYSSGLRNDDGRVISNFVTQALTGQDITVYGDGSQTRSFCYVDDNIRGLQKLMETEEANGEIINIGNPTEYSVLEVAYLVKKLAQSDSKLVFLPLPQDDPKVRRPVIQKAQEVLGWYPEISLEDGLKLTIENVRATLQETP